MAWYTRVSASSGPPLSLCVATREPPASHDIVEYTDPHTGQRERISGITAWAGNPDLPAEPGAVVGVVVATTSRIPRGK
jgi:hypothetical protein